MFGYSANIKIVSWLLCSEDAVHGDFSQNPKELASFAKFPMVPDFMDVFLCSMRILYVFHDL